MQTSQIAGFRLSPQQRRIWSLQQENPAASYCVQCAFLIAGNLDLQAFKDTLQAVVNRHEILRTTFQYLPGMTVPLQVIAEDSKISVDEHNLTDLSPQIQETKIESLFYQLRQRPFEPAKSPPISFHLLTLSSNKHLLFIRLSALIADGLTLAQILNEISALYGSNLPQQDVEIMQYADIAEWQHELLEDEDYSPGKEYWQNNNTYSEVSSLDFLSVDQQSQAPEAQELQVESVLEFLADDLAEQIMALAAQLDVAVSDVLLACWQILLWRITAQKELIIGVASSGRTHEELRSTLGALSKYLPLSCSLDRDVSFQKVIGQIKQSVNDAYEWQDYFAWEASASEDQSTFTSVYPFGFEFEEWPESYGQNGTVFSLHKRYVYREKFKVNLFCLQKGDDLGIECYYDAGLYRAEDIKNLSTWFLTLLTDAVSNPQCTIGQLQLLTGHQRQQVLADFNQTHADYSQNQCTHQLFEAQVEQTPDQVAVVFEDQQLTYAELNAKANQLARYLQELGVTKDQVVGIYLERSHQFIVSLLAILKAGGAYLPLDPALPKESLVFRLEDARVSVILTQTSLTDTLRDSGGQLIDLDTQHGEISQRDTTNLDSAVAAHSLAYVIFTSGSTGKPKGVAVEHRQLCNYSRAIAQKLDLSVCKSYALVSTFAADLGHTAIFPALFNGACLHIISTQLAANPEALAGYFERSPIDCLKIVPSHLSALLTSSRPQQILPRQRLILGGEACRWELIEQIYSHSPSCDIFNHYGPTETTVGVLTYPITQAAMAARPPQQETVPIGRPIANTQIYLLNTDLQPVPIGVPGELYIGGAGTARGYLNRDQLTAERFLANPFLSEPALDKFSLASTVYKTGDLVRYQPDGIIEFLGRTDHQVKIRGYRIELGEIESTIRQHSMVQETVVLARAAQSGNQRLVAYVVPQKQSDLSVDELRDLLKEKLPDYMVPAAFVRLKELPLTSNGKLDRQALPALESISSGQTRPFVAPTTDAEKALAEIWAKTLGIEKIGIHDNFFELGGDSILSIQIVSKANQAGLKVTPKQVFENQTVAELAVVVNTQQVIQAEQGPVLGHVPLIPIQHWFFELDLPNIHHWNQSVLLEVRRPLNLEHLEIAIQTLLKHHDALRLRYTFDKTGWQQYISEFDEVSVLTQINLSKVAEADQSEAITKTATELHTTLNLESGPLIRLAYFDLGTNKSDRLLLIIHHLAVDGVSWRIFLEDLYTVYQQLSQGSAVQLPPKTTSIQYWATQLTEYVKSETLQRELNHWLSQSAQSSIPVDFPGGDNTLAKVDFAFVALSKAETQVLLQEVPAAYKTHINDVLLTAVVQAFARWTGEYSLLVDLEGHGRENLFEDVDLSRTMGWFSTIFPAKLEIKKSDNLGNALKAIKEQLRGIPQRGIGYGILRYLGNRDDIRWQQAEVRFNYLGQTDQMFQQSSLFAFGQESKGPRRSLKETRRYLIDINSIVTDGQLSAQWVYSKDLYKSATIETLANHFMEALRALIIHCRTPEADS
ncbi:MAG: amino acid adenylation domain-containing protein [Cyanobacteria bacterium P01_H01_bin.21]